jgi:hypothetical protein
MMLIPECGPPGSERDPTVRLDRAAGPYYAFHDTGFEVVLASPDGGSPRMEFAGDGGASTGILQRFRQDRVANDAFSDTLRLDQVYADDFDAAFCVGAPGAIWQSDHKSAAGALLSRLLDAGKPVAIMPSDIELAPKGAGEGLLIAADGAHAPIPAAQALMGALRQLQIKPERNP